jgi:hypothetical protein
VIEHRESVDRIMVPPTAIKRVQELPTMTGRPTMVDDGDVKAT